MSCSTGACALPNPATVSPGLPDGGPITSTPIALEPAPPPPQVMEPPREVLVPVQVPSGPGFFWGLATGAVGLYVLVRWGVVK